MKTNTLFVGLVLSCIILLSYGQNCCILNSVKVAGVGENSVKPDIAIIYAYLSVDGSSASDALSILDTKISTLTSSLYGNGVSSDDLKTSSLSVYPRYNYTNGTSVIIGYTVYVSLTVTIRGIDKNSQRLAKTVDALASAGVSSIYGLSYDTSNPSAGKVGARNYAWYDATLKAKQYAQLAGRKLGKVLIIEETGIVYSPYYYSTTQSAGGLSAGNSSTDNGYSYGGSSASLPVGTILITVTVIVTW